MACVRDDAQGLAAGVGVDLPRECSAWLAAAGVDVSGLTPLADTPTPRAWQVLEHDGRRTQARALQPCARAAPQHGCAETHTP